MLGGPIVKLGDAALGRFTRVLARWGLCPPVANLLEFAAATTAAGLLAASQTRAAWVLLLAHGVCDYLDGALMRAAGRRAERRDVLRHAVVDKLSDVIIYSAIGLAGFAPRWLGVAAALSSVAVTALGLWLSRTRSGHPSIRNGTVRQWTPYTRAGMGLEHALHSGMRCPGPEPAATNRDSAAFDRSDRVLVLLTCSAFGGWAPACAAAVVLNVAVIAQRFHAWVARPVALVSADTSCCGIRNDCGSTLHVNTDEL